MSQTINTGTTTATISGSVNLNSSAIQQVKIYAGTSPTIGSANTSAFALLPQTTLPASTDIQLKNVEQLGRMVFGNGAVIRAGSVLFFIKNVYAGAINFTFKLYKIATDGTATQIGGNITFAFGAVGQQVKSLNNANTTLLAGEGLELRLISDYGGAGVTAGDGTGFTYMV